MNIQQAMSRMTLRQMEAADELWRAETGGEGPKLQEALAAQNYRAIAAMVAAKMRINGNADMTIDEAMDLELDSGDDAGEATGGNGGGPPRLSPATGS